MRAYRERGVRNDGRQNRCRGRDLPAGGPFHRLGGGFAGRFTEFADDEQGRRIFFHTEVDAAYGGRGLATILVQQALDATRSDARRIVPICELVAAFVGKHREYDDIVEPVTDEIRQWLADRQG